MSSTAHLVLALTVCAITMPCSAGFVQYVNDWAPAPSPEDWFEEVGSWTTVDFVGLSGQLLSDQYAALGVLFPGNDFGYTSGLLTQLSDGHGAQGGPFAGPSIEVKFDEPRTAFAIQFPGIAYIQLFAEGELLFTSTGWGIGDLNFLGLIGDQPFDEVHIIDPFGTVHIDNLYFGMPVPGPCAALVFAGFVWRGRDGRRRCLT